MPENVCRHVVSAKGVSSRALVCKVLYEQLRDYLWRERDSVLNSLQFAVFWYFLTYRWLFKINSTCWISVILCAYKTVMQWRKLMKKRPVQRVSSEGKRWKFQVEVASEEHNSRVCPTHKVTSKDGQLKTTAWITLLYWAVCLLHM